MVVICTECSTKFSVKDEKIPSKGAKVRCLRCKNILLVKPGNATQPASVVVQQKVTAAKEIIVENRKEQQDGDGGSNLDAPECNCPKGAPAWIVTFADLSTLMLTFFVLLLSFANTDIVKFKDMLGSVQDAFGVQKKVRGKYQATKEDDYYDASQHSSQDDSPPMDEKAEKAELEKMEVARKVEATIKSIKEKDTIKVTVGKDGVRVRVKGGYFFDPGSAELKTSSIAFLDKIGQLMKEFPFKLKVEGHTDNIPISTIRFPSNWELSAVRATTVLRYLIDKNKIKKIRLSAIGFADNKPIAENKNASGRAQNRRVEFIFFK